MSNYYGTLGDDYIDPLDPSDDYIFTDAGDDTVYGWYGNDILDGWTGDDVVFGEANDDILYGWTGDDYLDGGSGVDDLYGGGGDDTLDGGTNSEPGGLIGGDNMYGGPGDDIYYVDNTQEFYFDDVIEYANEGTDTVMSSADFYGLHDHVENVTLIGDAYGANGNDLDNVMTGNNYDNYLWGDTGDDSLIGQAGDDTLSGGSGDDTLTGSDPNVWNSGDGEIDTLYGGDGADTFVLGDSYEVYYQGLEGNALIKDFNGFDGDKIILHGSSEDYTVTTTLVLGPNYVSIYFGEEFSDRIVGIEETTLFGFSMARDVIFV